MATKGREARRRAIRSARETAEQDAAGFEPTAFKLPEGTKRFSLKKGRNRLDIIPFEVGKGNPRADEGEIHYERTYYIHNNVGPSKDRIVCLSRTFKKKCPICDEIARLDRDPRADAKEIKELLPKRRQLFNVINLDNPDDGIQIWDVSYHLFGKLLNERILNSDPEDEWDMFHDPERGFTLIVTGVEESIGEGRPFITASAIDFKDRKKPYKESIIDEAHCLDELLIEMEYEEMQKLFRDIDAPADDEEEGEAPRRRGRRSEPEAEEEEEKPRGRRGRAREEEEDTPAEEEEEAPRGRRRAAAAEPEPEEEEKPRGRGRRSEPEPEAEEEEKPRGRRGRSEEPAEEEEAPRSRRGRREEPEGGGSEDETWDDPEPAPRGRRGKPAEEEEEAPKGKGGGKSSRFFDEEEEEAPRSRRRSRD